MPVRRLLLPLLAAGLLAAQEPMPFLQPGPGTDRGWSGTLGFRWVDYSGYLGSDRARRAVVPAFSAEYDHRFYVGASQVGVGYGAGVHALRWGAFTWDLGLGVGDRRPESRSPLLDGMGDRRAQLFAGTGLHVRFEGFNAGLTLSRGLRDGDGDRATLRVGRALVLAPRWRLSLALHGTWEDARSMNYDFGITPVQAAAREALLAQGDPDLTPATAGPFSLRAGMRDAGAVAGLTFLPARAWMWTLRLNRGLLLGEVRDSPLVGKNDYTGLAVDVMYRF